MKKLMALFLAFVLAFGLVACAPNNGDQGETGGEKKPVTLTWYTRGPGMQNDTSKVNDAFNKLLQTYEGFEHVTVKFVPVVAKDYAQAVLLAQTTKEPLDILCTVGLNFVDEALNETIVPLDDLLKNTPELVSTLPEWLWNTQKVNGKIYTVPNYQRGVNPFYSYIPAEYQDCIDWEKFCELTTIDPTTGKIKGSVREVASILETYLLNVRKKTGSNTKYLDSIAKMYANPGTAMLQEYVDGSNIDGSSTTFFNPLDPNPTVNSIYLTEEYKEACKVVAEWQDKGYFPADVMTIKTADLTGENMMNDVAMVWSYNTSTAPTSEDTQEFYGETYGFDILAHHFSNVNYMSSRWGACGNAITYNCVSPTDAIALLDLINTEKGIVQMKLNGEIADERLLSIACGTRPNVVPGTAVAVLAGDWREQAADAFEVEDEDCSIETELVDGNTKIVVTGVPAHASTPDQGKNAAKMLIAVLEKLGIGGAPISLLDEAAGEGAYGVNMGIAGSDHVSGPLTLNLGLLFVENGKISVTFDCRYPVFFDDKTVTGTVAKRLAPAGFVMEPCHASHPHHVPESSELVTKLMAVYNAITETQAKPFAIGGGTYARHLKEGVAFGMMFPGEPELAHQANECIDVANYIKAARIYAYAIVALCA